MTYPKPRADRMPKKNLQIDNLDPTSLAANPWNTNVVSPDNERKLSESIKRFGFFKPILARELPDGTLQVLGGQHRLEHAIHSGEETVPVINLGLLDDQQAKEISLVDNGRYGTDDTLKLAELLESLGDSADLSAFMPFDTAEMESIFASSSIVLDDLELSDDEIRKPELPALKPKQDFQVLRFKVPIADAQGITDHIEKVMKLQKFTEDDSLTNAGLALVHIFQKLS